MGAERLRFVALWQEQSNNYRFYRMETNDGHIARKLRRRENTKDGGYYMNRTRWTFCLQYASLKSAKRGLEIISGPEYGPLEKDPCTGGFIVYSGTVLTPNVKDEV
jgi:hypothetical protein